MAEQVGLGVEDFIIEYMRKSSNVRGRMQSKLFEIFTETTGYRPEDICLVEQRFADKTIYFFDLKHRYQEVIPQGKIHEP